MVWGSQQCPGVRIGTSSTGQELEGLQHLGMGYGTQIWDMEHWYRTSYPDMERCTQPWDRVPYRMSFPDTGCSIWT